MDYIQLNDWGNKFTPIEFKVYLVIKGSSFNNFIPIMDTCQGYL